MKDCKIEPRTLVDLSQAQESLARVTQRLLSDTELDAKKALKELCQANKELTVALKVVTEHLREAAKPVEVPEPPAAVLNRRNHAALSYPIENLGAAVSRLGRDAELVILDYEKNQPIAYQYGIKTVGELVQLSAQELARVARFGEKAAEKLREALEPLGLSIGMELKPAQLKRLGITNFRLPQDWDSEFEFREVVFGQLAIERNAQRILGENVSSIPGLSKEYIDNLTRIHLHYPPGHRDLDRFEKVEKVWECVQLSLGRDLSGHSGNDTEVVAKFLLDHGLCFGMRNFPFELVKKFDIKDLGHTWKLHKGTSCTPLTADRMAYLLG